MRTGTCSNLKEDDFEGRNKTLIDSKNEFGASWLFNKTAEECECNPLLDRHCVDCTKFVFLIMYR